MQFKDTELILTPDNKVYHLNLSGDQIADDVIVVGDPGRVQEVSKFFDHIEFQTTHREFITHTGFFNRKRITVLSTGIGTDNIDIVLNELDAAVNIDLKKRELKKEHRRLNIYRLGTCGSLQPDVAVDTPVISTYGLGLDGLMNFYSGLDKINAGKISTAFINSVGWPNNLAFPYCICCSEMLNTKFDADITRGITATAPGFYGPQGREIRLKPALDDLNKKLTAFAFEGKRIVNFEMETSALYGLGKLLGHECLTICVVIANRATKEFSLDYKKSVDHLIELTLKNITR